MSSKLVSVMVPTRRRTALLKRSLESLRATCDLPFNDQIEVIVRCDDDDKETQEFLMENKDLWTTLVHGPRGAGYADLHVMYNEMCHLATGRFLFLWNDDAIMLTPGWDLELARHDDGKLCYLTSGLHDGRGRDQFLFPIVHRSYYDVLGVFSRSAHNDTYVYSVFKHFPYTFRSTEITIQHDALQINDVTSMEAKSHWHHTKSHWDSLEVQQGLATDVARLGQWLKQQGTTEVGSVT